jgi:hypothetical protein
MKQARLFATGLLALAIILLVIAFVRGDPVGGVISSNSTDAGRTVTPGSRTDDGGTFTTFILTATQQNYAWKAYVGNVSGSLVLDDSNNVSIYEWALTSTAGQVLVSRSGTLSWGALNCSSDAVIEAENAALNMGDGDVDNINNTLNYTDHKAFTIAGNTINADSCPSNAWFVSDAAQTVDSNAAFQQIALNDSSSNLIYASEIETAATGYNGEKYDFQLLLPDDDTVSQITPYYFYVELLTS